jgi:hypothetical protein
MTTLFVACLTQVPLRALHPVTHAATPTATATVNTSERKAYQLPQPLVVTCSTATTDSSSSIRLSDNNITGIRTAAAAAGIGAANSISASNSANNSNGASPAASPPSSQPASPRYLLLLLQLTN